jgi:hypothetical protein
MMNRSNYRLSFEGSSVNSSTQGAAPETGTTQAAPRESTFRRVEGGGETTSGSVLLIEAYAALWLILLAFLFVSWRRQSRIDERVADLERSFARLPGSK